MAGRSAVLDCCWCSRASHGAGAARFDASDAAAVFGAVADISSAPPLARKGIGFDGRVAD
jgi:hypothetical protein